MLDLLPKRERIVANEADPFPELAADFDLRWISRSTGLAERRQVVALAIGFEPVTTVEPEEILETLTRRHAYVAGIVARYRGTIDRLDPELQQVTWGWPTADEFDTRLAVAAALEIASGPTDIARCGVDVGIAIAPAGDHQLPGIRVVGVVTGRAAALQSAARWGSVVVSDTVRNLIVEQFYFTRLATVVEGAAGDNWTVDPSGSPPLVQVGPGGRGLVGLAGEIAQLQGCWRLAVEGRQQRIRIEGEAGIGKSALVAHLQRRGIADGGQIAAVRCLPETQKMAGEPIRKLCHALRKLAGHDGSAAPAIAAVASERQLLDELAALVRHCASRQPLLVVIEDLQFADTDTIAAVEHIAGLADPRLPLLLIATRRLSPTGRPAETSAGDGDGDHLRDWPVLQIGRLNAADVDRLLALSEPGAHLGTELRQRITERATGVPMHVLELARLYSQSSDRTTFHRLLARPNRLSSGLTRRLDGLGSLKPLAQAAAVAGRDFDTRVLAGVLRMDVRALAERLDILVGEGMLLRPDDNVPYALRFASGLQWSQIYGSLLNVRRIKLHADIADELRYRQADRCAQAPELVAYHHMKAGAQAQAFAWWSKAAHVAAAAGAATAVVSHVNQALAARIAAPAACSALDEAELMSLLGAQLRALHGSASSETIAAYERALELIDGLPSRPVDLGLDVAWGLAAILLVRGDIHDAVVMSRRLLDTARGHARGDIELLALRMHGTARLLSGRVAEAIEHFTAAAAMYEARRDGNLAVRYVSNPGAVALAQLSSAHALAGDGQASRAARKRALALPAEDGHPHTASNVLGVLSLGAIHLDEPGIAAALARASLVSAERHGNAYWAARAALILAWAKALRQPVPGMALLDEAIAGYHKTGAGRASVICLCLGAEIAIKAGMPKRALELLGPVQDKGQLSGEWIYIPEVLRLVAQATHALDPRAKATAMQSLEQAEALAREHGSLVFAQRAEQARTQIRNGEPARRQIDRSRRGVGRAAG